MIYAFILMVSQAHANPIIDPPPYRKDRAACVAAVTHMRFLEENHDLVVSILKKEYGVSQSDAEILYSKMKDESILIVHYNCR